MNIRQYAVLTRPELQFRHSQWIALRRQLDVPHKVGNYRLRYDEDRLIHTLDGFEQSRWNYRTMKKLKQEANTMQGDTVFLTLLRESCLFYYQGIIKTAVPMDEAYNLPIFGLDRSILG